MIDFSVVIPTYNRADKLCKSVESVVSQEGRGTSFNIKEIIVVDDCSLDDTQKFVQTLQVPDEIHLVYHRLLQNGGPSKARNEGVRLAGSEWIAFQDSDDLWHSDKLKEMVPFMSEHPDADLYSHFYEAVLDDNRTACVEIEEKNDYFQELSIRSFIGAPTVVVRKNAFEAVGGFDESMRALEDWDFALRFSYDHKIVIVPKVLMEVDLVSEGVSSNAGNYYDARCRILAKNRQILLERGTFNSAVQKLLQDAEKKGILKQVGNILEYYLTTQ